mgnify:CR=1 FL=1
MSSVKFEQEHQKFFKSLKNIQAKQQLDLDTIREQGGEFFQRTKLYKDNITGDTDIRGEFGLSISITCQAHVTRRNRLNIQEVRSGINKPGSVIPKNL